MIPSFLTIAHPHPFHALPYPNRYHLGSLAFGALLIAIVQMVRVILEYIDQKLKEYTDNPLVKFIMWYVVVDR